MSRSNKLGALIVGLCLVSFRLMIFIVEFVTAQKQTMSIADYVAQKPKGSWFELSNGVLDLSQATYFSFLGEGEVKDNDFVFIPVFAAGDSLREAPLIILASKNDFYRNKVNKLHNGSETEVIREMLEHHDDYIIETQVVKGYVANLKSDQSSKLHEHFPTASLILEENASPDYAVAAVLAVIWCVLLYFVIQNYIAEREEKKLAYSIKQQELAEKRKQQAEQKRQTGQ